MKKLPLIILLMIFYSIVFAQDVWIKAYNPFHDPYDEWAWDEYTGNNVMLLPDGNYLISASYEFGIENFYFESYGMLMKVNPNGDIIWVVKDSVSFENGFENVFTLIDQNGYIYSYSNCIFDNDSFMNKRASNGELIWTKLRYNETNHTRYKSGCITYDNCMVLAGRKFYAQGIDTLVLDKYDTEGNLIWHREYGEFEYPQVNSIIEADNHDIIFLADHSYGHHINIYRATPSGNIIWQIEIEDNTDYYNFPNSVIELSNNKIMISGEYDYSQGGWGGYLALFDSAGSHLWTRTFDNLSRINCILEDDEENVVFTSHLFTKYNYVTDEIVFENFLSEPNIDEPRISTGNKNIIKINDGYILSGGTNIGTYLLLFKTDLNGSVEANENIIIPVSKNLKYQNPFSESVKFEVVNDIKSHIGNKIEIYNLKGQKVSTIKSNDKNLFWDAKSMPSGIYFLHLNNENKIYKILKVK